MTRDKVLERLTDESAMTEGKVLVDAELLRAAAELIRAGGWREIAEIADENEYLTGGRWELGAWREYKGRLWWLLNKGCTHFLVSPEPPAREVENG